MIDADQDALGDHVVERLEGHPRIDGTRAIADQQGHVVDLARIARLDDEAAACAFAASHEMVMHGRGGEQARDGGPLAGDAAVGQDDDVVTGRDRLAGPVLQVLDRALEPGRAVRDLEQHRERGGLEPGMGHVAELGDVLVREHGIVEIDLATRLGLGREEIPLGPHRRFHGRHQLFTDLIERWIGDLREELLEIVVERPRLVREHGQRGIGAHGAEGLLAVLGHRREQQAQVFVRVAEGDLAREDALVIGLGDRLGREILEADEVLTQPRPVRFLGGELGLDLLVGDDPALRGVHQKDPAGVQSSLGEDVLRRDVEHADLRGHDDEVVPGHVVARGAKAVAVEHGADHRAVGEGDGRRAVPRLHERGVVLVERPPLRAHRLVVLPGLGNHHEDRVRQRAPAHDQELEHIVEGRRVREPLAGHREHLGQVLAEDVGPAERFPRAHPVDVAAQRVDLAVVGHEAIRVGQRPRREGVGAEPLVDEGQRRLDVGVGKIGEHALDLVGREHALVDERVRGEARHVHELLLGEVHRVDRVLDALADDVELALEVGVVSHTGAAPDEHLPHDRLHRARGGAQVPIVGGQVAPAQEALAFLDHEGLDQRLHLVALEIVAGQEREAGAVLRRRRQREAERRAHLAQEFVGHLQQDAGAVAGVRLAPAGAPVQEVDQDLERLAHDGVRLSSLDVDDEADAAGVVLVAGIVETLSGRRSELVRLHHGHSITL